MYNVSSLEVFQVVMYVLLREVETLCPFLRSSYERRSMKYGIVKDCKWEERRKLK